MNRGAWLRWLIGLAVSVVFLWLAFRAINPAEVWQAILDADQRFLVPATLCTAASYVFRYVRWKLCFEPEDGVSLRQASAAYGVGIASAQVIPARLGDLVRVYFLGQVSSVSKGKALGTLVIERLSDLFTVVMLLAVLLPLFSLPSWVQVADGFAAVVAIAVLLVVFVLARRAETLVQPKWMASRSLTRLGFGLFMQVLTGFSAIRDPRRGLQIMLASFAVWIAQTGTYAFSLRAVHIPLGWKEGALTTGVLALTAIIPAGPGFAGSFEIATQNLLAVFNVDRSLATAYLEYTRIPNLIAVVVCTAIPLLLPRLWPAKGVPSAGSQ